MLLSGESCAGIDILADLMGDDAAEPADKLVGNRGTSKKLPGCREAVGCWDSEEALLEVFLRS